MNIVKNWCIHKSQGSVSFSRQAVLTGERGGERSVSFNTAVSCQDYTVSRPLTPLAESVLENLAKLSLSYLLWIPQSHYHIHRSPSFDPIVSQLRSFLILSSHLCLDFPSGHFQSGCPTKTLYVFHLSAIHATCHTFHNIIDLITGHACMHTYIHTYICTYIYIYIYIYIYTFMHKYTNIHSFYSVKYILQNSIIDNLYT